MTTWPLTAATQTETVRQVVELRFYNVPPAYARELAALGYRGLPSRQVLELYRAGASPEFIRAVRDPSGPAPSVDMLLQRVEEAKARGRRMRTGG